MGLKEVNRKIDGKLKEIDKDADRVKATRKVLQKTNATERELDERLDDTRKQQDKQRDILKDIRKDLDAINEDDEVSPDEQEEFDKLTRRREILADKLDATVAMKQHLLERLDDLGEREKAVRDRLEKKVKEREQDQRDLDNMRKRRAAIRKERQQAKNQPSPNFTYAEFNCNDGTPIPEASKPAIKDLCQKVLEPQRARFGSVHINSGFRTAAYNARIGGASNSVHIYSAHPSAVAADHTCAGGGATDWFNNTAGRADGRGRYSTFHHADNRNRMGWPDAVWSG